MSPLVRWQERLKKRQAEGWEVLFQHDDNRLLVLKNDVGDYQVHFKSSKCGCHKVQGTSNPGRALELRYCPDPPCDRQ